MKNRGLTDKQVKHMDARSARYEVAAGPPAGLYLVVQPSGAKSWALRYRYRGRTRKLTLPAGYPAMGLAVARAEAKSRLDNLDNDIDPAQAQAEEIRNETPESVKAVAEEWFKRHLKPNTGERTQDEFERIVRKEVLPAWRDKLITEVLRPDVLRIIDGIMDRGTPILANKTLAVMKSWFTWTVERGYIEVSPAVGIRPPTKAVSRDRVLDAGELADVWHAAEGLGYPYGAYIRCLILLPQRREEVATMKWADIDLKQQLWTTTIKGGKVLAVPLSKAAVDILWNLPEFTKGDFVWTTTSGVKAINGFSKAKERIDKETLKRRTAAGLKENVAPWTLHDLRRTSTTMMAEQGVQPHILSALLGHSTAVTVSAMPSAAITKVYNRYAYLDEKRQALEAWAQFVVSLTKPAATAATA